jgi:hypothetical protein
MAGDFDCDFEAILNLQTTMNKRQQTFLELVDTFSKEFQEVSNWPRNRAEPVVQVLGIFCGSSSELTKQVNNLGYRACRHGCSEGDLSTKSGRQALFSKVMSCRPQHIWYSPTCGPWGSWSQLNEIRTDAGFQVIQMQRDEQLYQLALLFRFQVRAGLHMH